MPRSKRDAQNRLRKSNSGLSCVKLENMDNIKQAIMGFTKYDTHSKHSDIDDIVIKRRAKSVTKEQFLIIMC